jgi:hypothetical protein
MAFILPANYTNWAPLINLGTTLRNTPSSVLLEDTAFNGSACFKLCNLASIQNETYQPVLQPLLLIQEKKKFSSVNNNIFAPKLINIIIMKVVLRNLTIKSEGSMSLQMWQQKHNTKKSLQIYAIHFTRKIHDFSCMYVSHHYVHLAISSYHLSLKHTKRIKDFVTALIPCSVNSQILTEGWMISAFHWYQYFAYPAGYAKCLAHGSIVHSGTRLQTGRLWVQFLVLLDFSIDLVLPAALWPGADSVSNRNQKSSCGWRQAGTYSRQPHSHLQSNSIQNVWASKSHNLVGLHSMLKG